MLNIFANSFDFVAALNEAGRTYYVVIEGCTGFGDEQYTFVQVRTSDQHPAARA